MQLNSSQPRNLSKIEFDLQSPTKNVSQPVKSPTFQDVYICCGTIPNYAALRHTQDGSLFIQAFVEVLAEYSHAYDFDELMTLVQSKLNVITKQYKVNTFQTISYEKRGVTKKLHINPGFYGTIKRKSNSDIDFDHQCKKFQSSTD